jgi:Ca2+-binding EF-hand superfamily protein
MAQAIRRHADLDGDYYVTGRELRDAAAELFYSMVDESHPDSLNENELAAGLSEILRDFAPPGNRGFFGLNRGAGSAGPMWARAAFEMGDTDNDGKLTLAEVTDLVTRLACLSDRDNNDKLDEREIIEGLDRLAVPNPSPQLSPYRRTFQNRLPARRNGGGVVR